MVAKVDLSPCEGCWSEVDWSPHEGWSGVAAEVDWSSPREGWSGVATGLLCVKVDLGWLPKWTGLHVKVASLRWTGLRVKAGLGRLLR